MYPVKYEHNMEARLQDGSTMGPAHITTLPLTLLSEESIHIHIFPETKIAPLISLVVLCYDGCTITIDKKTDKNSK